MSKPTKYAVSTIILLNMMGALCAPIALCIVRSHMRSIARQAALVETDNGKWKTYSLSSEQFREVSRDEGKEIEIDGTMYDIVRTTKTNNGVTIIAIEDNAETGLQTLITNKLNKRLAGDEKARMMGDVLKLLQVPAVLIEGMKVFITHHFTTLHSFRFFDFSSFSISPEERPPNS